MRRGTYINTELGEIRSSHIYPLSLRLGYYALFALMAVPLLFKDTSSEVASDLERGPLVDSECVDMDFEAGTTIDSIAVFFPERLYNPSSDLEKRIRSITETAEEAEELERDSSLSFCATQQLNGIHFGTRLSELFHKSGVWEVYPTDQTEDMTKVNAEGFLRALID